MGANAGPLSAGVGISARRQPTARSAWAAMCPVWPQWWASAHRGGVVAFAAQRPAVSEARATTGWRPEAPESSCAYAKSGQPARDCVGRYMGNVANRTAFSRLVTKFDQHARSATVLVSPRPVVAPLTPDSYTRLAKTCQPDCCGLQLPHPVSHTQRLYRPLA